MFVIYVNGEMEETVMYDDIEDIKRHIREHYTECGIKNVSYIQKKESE